METRRPAGLTQSLEAAIHQACTQALEQAETAHRGFRRLDEQDLLHAEALGRDLRQRARDLTVRVLEEHAAGRGSDPATRSLLTLPGHLERLADHLDALVDVVRLVREEGLSFTDRARQEFAMLADGTLEVLRALRDLVRTWNPAMHRHLLETARQMDARTDEIADGHLERLILGICVPRSSSAFVTVLDHLSSVRRHVVEMAARMMGPPATE